MSTKKKKTTPRLIPKDFKNINKYISTKEEKKFINLSISLSQTCKKSASNLIAEKFVDFMIPIQDVISEQFENLYKEIMRRYSEIYSSKNIKVFTKNLELISSIEIHTLYDELEKKILESGKIILNNSNTIDAIKDIYNKYLKKIENITLDAAKLKNLVVIHQIQFIQLDTKNYINNLVHSTNVEAFNLYSEEMDRYFLDIHSFIDNNNRILLEHITNSNKTKFAKKLESWANETKNDITNKKNKIFTQYKYKDLNKLAIQNGFLHNRTTGGHGIFINKDGLIVVIPQGRDIGKGLQLKILKNIGIRY